MVAGGFGRVAIICLVAAATLAACSGGDSGSEASSSSSSNGGTGGSDAHLPSTDSSDPKLPGVDEQPSDTVLITPTTSTTTTQPPTTTTTIPPPVIPSDVLFDSGSSNLKPEAAPYLEDLAKEIRQRHPNALLRFIGHTDSRGTEAENQALSEDRAISVMDWFVAFGFDPGRLSSRGAGESETIERDVDADGQYNETAGARNRRVEIEITGER